MCSPDIPMTQSLIFFPDWFSASSIAFFIPSTVSLILTTIPFLIPRDLDSPIPKISRLLSSSKLAVTTQIFDVPIFFYFL